MTSRGSIFGVAAAVVGVAAGTFWLFRRSQSKKDLRESTTPKGDEKSTPGYETKTTDSETSSDAKSTFEKGAGVVTPWGSGQVVNYRAEDKIYEVLLEVDEDARATVFCQEDWLKSSGPKYSIGEIVSTPLGDGIVEDYRSLDRIYTVRHSWDDHGSAHSYLPPTSVWPKLSKFKVGDLVQTPSGPGKIIGYSSADGIYEVDLKFDDHGGARAYLTEENVSNLRRSHYALERYGPGDKVQTPYGPGTVKSFREDDQIYEIGLQFDGQGSASAFLPAEVIEASAPSFGRGDYVLTPQGPGTVHEVLFSDNGILAPSYEVELDNADRSTYTATQLTPFHGFLSEPNFYEEEKPAPILQHDAGFIGREYAKDKFQHVFNIAKGWLTSVGASDDDVRAARASFIEYLAKDQKLPDVKYFVSPAHRQTLAHVVNYFQKTYGECHPGLASVAAFLLLFLSAPEVIAYLAKIHNQPRYLPFGFTKKSLEKVSPLFSSALQHDFPTVHKHLESQFILPAQIVENWLFYLNTNTLPFYSLVYFFTQFSHLGYSYVIQFGLSLTNKLTEDNLIFSVKETSQIYSLFKLDFHGFKVNGKELHDLGFEQIADSWEILDTERTDKYDLTRLGVETKKALAHADVPEPEWEEGEEEDDEGEDEEHEAEGRFVIGS